MSAVVSSGDTSLPGYLFVLPWSLERIGGVNEVVRRLYDALDRHGRFRPLVLEVPWSEEERSSSASRRLAWMRLHSAPLDHSPLSRARALYHMRRPGALLRLRHFLREQNVRVVNVHYPGLSLEHFATLHRYRLHDFAFVASFHGSDLDNFRCDRRRGRMARALTRVDAIVSPSDALAVRIADVFPAVRPRIHRIYNGIDAEEFLCEAAAAEQHGSADVPVTPYVLHVGNFEPVKAHDVLLDAWARVAAVRPDLRLLAVGRAGPTLGAAQERAARPDLVGRVEIRTNLAHEAVAALMRSASAVVLPSRLETFPLVLLEAGAMARPVVASAVGGIPELLRDGETGLLVPPEDEEALASTLLDVLADPERAGAMGARLERRVREHFTWDMAATGYERVVASRG